MAHNLADPAYEPTDEELQELLHQAFSHLGQARRESNARIHSEIERLREEIRRRYPLAPAPAR